VNKILISAEVLQKLIFDRPEIEIELIGSAVAQISGRVADKIKEKLPDAKAQIDKAIREQLATFTTNTRLHDPVKVLIREYIRLECAALVKVELTQAITDAALLRVDDLVKARMLKVDKEVEMMLQRHETAHIKRIQDMAAATMLDLLKRANAIPQVPPHVQ
jgi:hypothetical protein